MSKLSLEEFAETYKVKVHFARGNKSDHWGIFHGDEDVIPGRFGEIAQHSGSLEIRITAVPRNADMNKALNSRAKQAESGGLSLVQRNGFETVWAFDGNNAKQANLAIRLIAPRRKRTRIMTEEQKIALSARLASVRMIRTAQMVA